LKDGSGSPSLGGGGNVHVMIALIGSAWVIQDGDLAFEIP
jgi:hypothetical protein